MRRRIPPATRGRIDAVRGALRAIARLERNARESCIDAVERHGHGSREHTRAYARHDESDRILHGVYRLLERRLEELENGGVPDD